MIESNLIKRFIVKSFMRNSREDLQGVADYINDTLNSRFLLNESVYVKTTRRLGKIRRCENGRYCVVFEEDNREECFDCEALERKYNVTYADIVSFLECITEPTAFGRILIENVFEKITQPGFGAPKAPAAVAAGGQRYGERRFDARREFMLQEVSDEYAGAELQAIGIAGAEHSGAEQQVQQPLDLEKLEPLAVEGYNGPELKLLVKVYMFFYSFRDDLGLEEFSLDTMAETVADPDYSTELAFHMHAKLIKILEAEIKSKKEKFYDAVRFIVEKYAAVSEVPPKQTGKKRFGVNKENWKAYVRLFILSFGCDAQCEKMYRFLNFSKRGELALRLELLATLIDMLTYTETFRVAVAEKQSVLRSEKMKQDQVLLWHKGKIDGSEEEFRKLEAEMRDYPSWVVNHPLKIHLGKYLGCVLFVMDRQIFAKSGDSFYRLKRDDVLFVMRNLNPSTKQAKAMAFALKRTVDVLYMA